MQKEQKEKLTELQLQLKEKKWLKNKKNSNLLRLISFQDQKNMKNQIKWIFLIKNLSQRLTSKDQLVYFRLNLTKHNL